MIAIISDIHGNYPAFQSVMQEIDRLGCEKIICLGDVVGYYCMPNECIDLLRKRNIHTLLGNHDFYMISSTYCNSKTVKMCIDYQKGIVRHDNFEWLQSLKPAFDNELMSLRHGGWNDAIEERLKRLNFEDIKDMPQKYFFSGHTHIQRIDKSEEYKDKIYCNPGSIGQPRDNDPRAAFAVIGNDSQISLHRVSYDIDEIVEQMKKNNQGDWIWENLYNGKKIGD